MERIDKINLFFTGTTTIIGIYSHYVTIDPNIYNIIKLIIVLYLIYDIYEKKYNLHLLKYNNEINQIEKQNKIIRNNEVIIHHGIFLCLIYMSFILDYNFLKWLVIESSTFFLTLQKKYNVKIVNILFYVSWLFCRFIYLPYLNYKELYCNMNFNTNHIFVLININIIFMLGLKWTLELLLEKSQRYRALKCYESSLMLIIPQLISMDNHINKNEILCLYLLTIFSAGKYTLRTNLHKYYIYFDTGYILLIIYYSMNYTYYSINY